MPRNPAHTRHRIVEAAAELFYCSGVKGVSVDDIADRAGVTKRTLYNHYASKDELITDYLQTCDEPTISRYQAWVDGKHGTLTERIARMFSQIGKHAENSSWKGCGFARVAVELAGAPDHPAITVVSKHKRALETWLADLASANGAVDGQELARQLAILLDGVVTQILIHRDPGYARSAARVAAMIVQNATRNRQIQSSTHKRGRPLRPH